METLLGLVFVSFLITALALVPFIDLLYFLKRYFGKDVANSEIIIKPNSDTPIHDQLMKADFGTPHGGGVVIIPILVIISAAALFYKDGFLDKEFFLLTFVLFGFGILGFIDDVRHITQRTAGKFKGIRTRIIFPIQIVLALGVACALYFGFGLNNIYLPIFGNVVLGLWYIPLAILAILAFANGINISDGLDGLSTGLLTICLVAFLALASTVLDLTLGVFIGVWLGALIAYLYFNVYPARVYLGDAGAFGFGATLAVIGLLTGKILALGVVGGVYMVILLSSFIQIMSKKLFKRKVFPVAPIHMYFKHIGWPEPKIVMRFWLVGAMCAILGLWLGLHSL